MPARLTVLSGPSGVGKSTVVQRLRALVPQVWVSVSCTTRPPRPGEADGAAYYFVDRAEFERMVDAGEFLEHAAFAGNCYGTPRSPVLERLDTGVPVLLEIELQGARQVRAAMPDARLVFLAPPSADELRRRLARRRTEGDADLAARLERARAELAAAGEFHHVVVNSDVETAAAQIADLVTAP
jgi:guanylate kinase